VNEWDILHGLHHFWLAFLGGVLAWLLTWIIWWRVYLSAASRRPQPGHAAKVARSIGLFFWALLCFLAIGSHMLLDYWAW
jgi:cell division protein FtsX